ncbi:lysoplasmalogenase [Aestuariibius sp. HNIBRBA575]|uniref:lysoplasmalogenase n=1 Tax=Aestuariibius sp. HNIBRBA575 TaxID=3233343 RepID=UPI0034A238BF
MAILYLPRTSRKIRWNRSIRKTLPLALFALAAWAEGSPPLLVAGLALSAAGDFALSRAGKNAFLLGMLAFAGAHLAYLSIMIPFTAAPNWGLFGIFMMLGASTEIWLIPKTDGLKWPVRIYIVIILAMGIAALGLPGSMMLATLGAVMFILSDLILSIEIFILPDGHKVRWVLSKMVWITYIAAQCALFLALGGG